MFLKATEEEGPSRDIHNLDNQVGAILQFIVKLFLNDHSGDPQSN